MYYGDTPFDDNHHTSILFFFHRYHHSFTLYIPLLRRSDFTALLSSNFEPNVGAAKAPPKSQIKGDDVLSCTT